MEYRCVQCGFRVKSLFVQYSPGNIRLMKCENCKEVADEYIECEFMIILIDLILHKPKAYRHLLYNVFYQKTLKFEGLLWKSACGYLLLDAYRSLLLRRTEEQWTSSIEFSSLVWICQMMLMDVFFGNFMLFSVYLLAAEKFLNRLVAVYRLDRYRDLLLAILVSSYFKIFLIAMAVWEFPSSAILIIDLFVLSSNAVALKVITESSMDRCIGACIAAHAVKYLASQVFRLRTFCPAIISDYQMLSSL